MLKALWKKEMILEFDVNCDFGILFKGKVWSKMHVEEEIIYFHHFDKYGKICLDWNKICQLISDILTYKGNCSVVEMIKKFINYKWRILCYVFCWNCGDLTYCKKCNVRLYCSCTQKGCLRTGWTEFYVSFSNDLPNCWCTDCHVLCCWNGLCSHEEIDIV